MEDIEAVVSLVNACRGEVLELIFAGRSAYGWPVLPSSGSQNYLMRSPVELQLILGKTPEPLGAPISI